MKSMMLQLSQPVTNIILGCFKRILRFPQDLLVFYGKIWVKNQGNFFQQIFGRTTFVDKMATLLMETYGLGPSNRIMLRNCDTFFIAPGYHFYTPYDPQNLYFLTFCGISQHKSTFVDQHIFCWKVCILSFSTHFLPCNYL